MQAVYDLQKVEIGWKLTGPTLEKPVYTTSRFKAMRRALWEIMKRNNAESFTISISSNGQAKED